MERPIDEKPVEGPPRFRVARNPDPESRLPYLIWLPIEGGLVLKARETWPRANRVCAQDATGWDESVGGRGGAPVPASRCRHRPGARPAGPVPLSVCVYSRSRPA